MNDWVDELNSKIAELLSDHKKVKFSTYKNRKAFIANVQNLIENAIKQNTKQEDKEVKVETRKIDSIITRPNPNPSPTGFSVMTEKLSTEGDESLQRTMGSKKGLGSW